MSDCSFSQRALNIHPSGVVAALFGSYMAGATRNCCRLGAFCVHHTNVHHITSLYSKPRTYGAYVFSCKQPPALLAEWPGFVRATAVTRGWTDAEIRVRTESWAWRRNFSRRCSPDSNPRPFDHESGVLTTELSPPRVNTVKQEPRRKQADGAVKIVAVHADTWSMV